MAMSEKKYVFPPEMGVYVARTVFNECGKVDFHPQIRVALEAALRWLGENPIVPTAQQVGELVLAAPISATRQDYAATIFCMTEWQKRMFLAPEPVEDWTDRLLVQFPSGRTPTHDELDKLWNNIFRAGHGWVPPEQRAEVKIKEEIEDLLFRSDVDEKGRTMSGNERIKEAYCRGKKAGEK
jgi:hypothetical protein